jgi:hypothetical protein
LNEYIFSSLTEEKEASVLYFAHRSFQEFLVADHLRTVRLTPDQHVTMSAAITPDIRSLLDEAPDKAHLATWFETLTASEGRDKAISISSSLYSTAIPQSTCPIT